ncbi:alpha-amylase family glycosyl hydrolase [Flavicella sp.]|uniref:alpha-amylase family glycosyl hydrolase n=1 Tax=Flavicella sp. TaxID=2957742 RepID=UPI0030188083
MKKLLLIFILAIPNIFFSQITTSPLIPTINSEITLVFDASSTPLADYTGDIYAHTSVTIDSEQWQYVIGTWNDNTTQPKFTRDDSNSNLYRLKISPNIHTFYTVETNKTITEISIVIRSTDGSLQNGSDIFIPIYDDKLNIVFSYPTEGSAFEKNQNITFTAETTVAADLEILIDDISISKLTNTSSISADYSFITTGNHTIKAIAINGEETKTTSLNIFIKTTTQNIARPNNEKSGITIENDEVTFVLLAPNKSDIVLLGDFNNWTIDENYLMHKDGDYFWITLYNLDSSEEYAYQYYIDYQIKIADPYSEKILDPNNDIYINNITYPDLKPYPTGFTTGNVSSFKIAEEPYAWSTSTFVRPNQDNLVIYEMHIRDFTEKSSFNEAITHLDYLKELGINAIELMPVNEFEGNDSWGYNPSFYLALDKAYGTKNDFKNFIDECHIRGIAVLSDVVFNHSYSQSPLLQMYWNENTSKPAEDNPWYNENHNLIDNTSAHWGYDFNHTSTYTKAFFKDVLSYWMNEYKIDGFRFDFTKGFSNTIYEGEDNWASTYDADRIEILKEYTDHVWNTDINNKPYVIFEHLSDNSEEKVLADYGILLWGNLNHSYTENTMGFGDNIDWISYKQRGWNTPSVLGYMESHDEERMMYKNLEYGNETDNYSVKNLNTALSRQETAGAFLFSIPGPKMIWQFGELGYDISIDENGRTGQKPVLWEYFTNVNRKHIYDTWSTFIAFKNKHEVFNTNDFSLNTSELLKSITLNGTEMDAIVLGNFDIENSEIDINFTQTGTWYEYFSGEILELSSTNQTINLDAGQYKLYTTKKVYDPRGGTENDDSDNDGINDLLDLCPNTLEGAVVDENGCALFTLDTENFTIKTTSETCAGQDNGILTINSVKNYNFTALFNGEEYNFQTELIIKNITANTYQLCIYTEQDPSFEQCYELTIEAGSDLSGKITSKINGNNIITNINILTGTAPYKVLLNNINTKTTSESNFNIATKVGDQLIIESANNCEGILNKTIITNSTFTAYPNPSKGNITLIFENIITENVSIQVIDMTGKTVYSDNSIIKNGIINLDLTSLSNGIYFIKTIGKSTNTIKLIKK